MDQTERRHLAHVVVDFSNVNAGLRDLAERRGDDRAALRIDPRPLLCLAAAGLQVHCAWTAIPLSMGGGVAAAFRAAGYRVAGVDVGRQSGREAGGDEVLQNGVLLELAGGAASGKSHDTLVLVTGDGAGSREGAGFVPLLRAGRRLGLATAVLAVEHTASRRLKAAAQVSGVFVELDRYLDQVTFAPGRPALPLRLDGRAMASPRPWTDAEGEQLARVVADPSAEAVAAAVMDVRVRPADRPLLEGVLRRLRAGLAAGRGLVDAADAALNDWPATDAERVRAALAFNEVVSALTA